MSHLIVYLCLLLCYLWLLHKEFRCFTCSFDVNNTNQHLNSSILLIVFIFRFYYDEGLVVGKLYGNDFTQTSISHFEALNLSFKNVQIEAGYYVGLRMQMLHWITQLHLTQRIPLLIYCLEDEQRKERASKRQSECHSKERYKTQISQRKLPF